MLFPSVGLYVKKHEAIIYRSYGSYIFSNRFYSSYMYSRPILIKFIIVVLF